jgi:outer membrane protein assembly factor BamA
MPVRPVELTRVLLLAALIWQATGEAGRAQSRSEAHTVPLVDGTEAADEVTAGVDVDDSFGIYALPIPIVDPTIGNGLGVGVLTTFRLDEDDDISPRSTVALGAGYTDTDTYAAGAGTSLYLDEDRWRVNAIAGGANANLDFYGIGSSSLFKDHPLDFNIRGAFASGNVRGRVIDHLYIGPLFKYLDSTASFDTALPAPLQPDDLEFELVGAGLIAEYDSRDSTFAPHSGSYGELELTRFDKGLGSGFNFFGADGSLAHYLELTPGLVLAGQARVAAVDGDPPFFALPYITLRGFPGGKYLDESTWQVQAEARWRAFWRIGLVAFAGMGQTAPDFGDLDDADLLYSGGIGLRFVASEHERVNLSLDFAWASDDDTAFYVRIGEAF